MPNRTWSHIHLPVQGRSTRYFLVAQLCSRPSSKVCQHANFSRNQPLQREYSNGALGAMIIYGPKTAEYDVDLGPVLLTDWYRQDYHLLREQYFEQQQQGVPPTTTINNFMNGKNNYPCLNTTLPCTSNAGLSKFKFQSRKNIACGDKRRECSQSEVQHRQSRSGCYRKRLYATQSLQHGCCNLERRSARRRGH